MSVAELEKRVRALEQEVAPLRRRVSGEEAATRPWWQQIAGSFKGDRAFVQAMKLGRQYRESLRPGGRKRTRT